MATVIGLDGWTVRAAEPARDRRKQRRVLVAGMQQFHANFASTWKKSEPILHFFTL